LVLLVDKTGVPDKKHLSPYASNKFYHINKIRESTGQSSMDNPETRTMLGTRHRTNTKNKNKTKTGKKNTQSRYTELTKKTDVNPGARER
jgi:hypothetical protein